MTKDEHQNTRQLIATLDSKDRRFRMAQSIFMALVFLVLVGVVFVQSRTLQNVKIQLDQQRQLLQAQKDNTEELKATTANVSRQLDCIARFFATRDRATATITDLDQCTIVRPDGSIVTLDLPQARATQPGPTNQPQISSQPAAGNSNSQAQTPSNPQQPENPIAPLPEPVPDPVEILGIPACVPFTGLCIR